MKALNELWDKVRGVNKSLDALDVAVRREMQRPRAPGRELPFFYSSKFLFTNGDMEERESPLVESADRLTKVTSLTYDVTAITQKGALVFAGAPPDYQAAQRLRPSRAGMFNQWTLGDDDGTGTNLFDFEWSFRLGSTERRYTNGRTVASAPFNARTALGNPELPNARLLFSPANPLVLNTNEFLTFIIKPTLYNPDLSYSTEAVQFLVEIQATGFRSFDDT